MPPEFGRDVDRLLVLELKRELEPDESEPPDAAAELADAVTALRLATAGAIAAGPVVFERLDFRPLRISPLLPIAATQPRGERDPARQGPRAARRRPARAAARSPTTIASSARRSTAGSSRCSRTSRSARARCARRSSACSAADGGALGGDDAGRGPARREDAASAASCSTRLRAERLDRDARDAVRRALVETLLHGNRRELVAALDETLLGLRPRPRPCSRRLSRPLRTSSHEAGTDTSHPLRLRSRHGRAGRTRCSRGSSGSRRSRGAAAPASELLGELRALVPRGRGVGAGRGRRPRAGRGVETSRGGGRNELSRPEMALHMGLARLLPRPNVRPASVPAPAETQVIALANQKGGVAKTTTTLNLGVAFAEQGYSVLLIDLDPQGNLTMSQGLNPDTIETLDVRRARPPPADRAGDPDRARSTSPSRRSISPAPTWRCRARSAASARSRRRWRRSGTLRLHPHRHAAVARAADDQRVRRGDGRHRPGADRVPLAARPRAAREHAARWCART